MDGGKSGERGLAPQLFDDGRNRLKALCPRTTIEVPSCRESHHYLPNSCLADFGTPPNYQALRSSIDWA